MKDSGTVKPPEPWPRTRFEKALGPATLVYVVYGSFGENFEISAGQYRTRGVSPGMELQRYTKEAHDDAFFTFLGGHWGSFLEDQYPGLADLAQDSGQCLVVRGELEDAPNLNAFRDVVGLLAYLMDRGGVAMLDLLQLRWFSAEAWRDVFDRKAFSAQDHVVTLVSSEERQEAPGKSLKWLHTRGLRKFARPDLSLHDVPSTLMEPALIFFSSLIDLLTMGYVLSEGEEVNAPNLPAGMSFHPGGDLEDPDFNNVHVEIRWPPAAAPPPA